MRAPSPESSCHSSDCEGDKIVHAMKRLKIDKTQALESAVELVPDLRRKVKSTPESEGRSSPMVVDSGLQTEKLNETERRKRMMELLQSQLRQYKSQYSMITDGPDIAPCE
jgi:hypothetical protein